MDALTFQEKTRFILTTAGLQYLKPAMMISQDYLAHTPSDMSNLQSTADTADAFTLASKEGLTSMLGSPVFADIILSYTDDNGNTTELQIIPALITLHQTKDIVKTKVKGRKGTVKEYISDGDYDVNIDGALYGENNNYPIEDFKKLIALTKVNDAIKVTSKFLQLFDIHYLVIDSHDEPQSTFINRQSFSLKCSSDEPFELVYNDEL